MDTDSFELTPKSTTAGPGGDDTGVSYVRVSRPGDEPPPVPGMLEAAVLDMHHGFLNLGHESIVDTLLRIGREERLNHTDSPKFRVVSYDVRRGMAVPAGPVSRFTIVVGTGGPGALDPRLNDGKASFSQGVAEDAAWEAPLFHFFDRVIADEKVHLLGICHSYGLLARWSGAAEAVLRPEKKGGKSMGAVQNVLTAAAKHHPWFSGLYRVRKGPVIKVLDSRLFDLIPTGRGEANVLAYESNGRPDSPGEAVTMLEFARDPDGFGPRVWGVNHHPEIGDRGQQRARLRNLAERGEVSAQWVEERAKALDAWNASIATERGLQWTSSFTFEGPIRRIIARAMLEALRLRNRS
ncbi:MAG: hypothetical protein L6R30_20305 [Thermoanaerobaculia bacterium]|nr:hypothetical protein [Thermoanaerobaculia bacterium]